ncbi:hypothetical protein VTK26DRAFT_1752 [Humicola hyalothermophila]
MPEVFAPPDMNWPTSLQGEGDIIRERRKEMNTSAVSTPTPRSTRRTRIVCIGDTHNSTPKLPKGDVLIHAGDLTNQGSYSEISKTIQWLERADFEAKIVIAGNHDISLDPDFYSKHGPSFRNYDPQDPERSQSLLASSPTITYLQHGSATVRLSDPKGPATEFTVFGSPYSPEYRLWAFNYRRSNRGPDDSETHNAAMTSLSAADLWAAVPEDIDILVTHTPPHGHCDDAHGCPDLQKTLAKVRPRLHVCGHIHQGRGAERVRWDTDDLDPEQNVAREAAVEQWQDPNPDPASPKISLIDLTARGGKRPLDFHDPAPPTEAVDGGSCLSDPSRRVPCSPCVSEPESQDRAGLKDSARGDDTTSICQAPDWGTDSGANSRRQPRSVCRQGRRETCVVNCAIAATAWPHIGGKRFNKPIVVDVDLPVWRE